ncbi:MAG TPA: FUSC family protein, partial [Acidimicrobiales bacterium]
MTEVETPEVAAGNPGQRAVRWLRAKDPGLLAVKRSLRAAIVMPSVFAIAHASFSNSQVSLFAAFGSVALLLMVEFTGPPRTRVLSYSAMFVVGCAFIALGTTVSTNKVAAVVTMGVVGFVVLFAGIVSPLFATAATAALLTFVLPVAVEAPASQIGYRLLGWAMASAACTLACLFLWPPPWHENLRRRLADATEATARLIGAWARGDADPARKREVTEAVGRLRTQFAATAYPPTGAASSAVALSKLVGRVEWVASNPVLLGDDDHLADPRFARERAQAATVMESASDTLSKAARLISDDEAHPVTDRASIAAAQEANRHLDALIDAELAADLATLADEEAVPAGEEAVAESPGPGSDSGSGSGESGSIAGNELDPGFRARGLGIVVGMVADAALAASGAEPADDRRVKSMAESTAQNLGHRLRSYLSFRSVWFRNAVRGTVGLALAVGVVELTDVQHGFWVVLGTISVLRSNAFGTGASALRAIGGTAIGVVVGSAIMIGVGDNSVLLWVLLPIAVLIAGIAPSMISFVAAQAGFTLVIVILFNIIEPVGWRVGLTRIEDVALGCGVSVVVGFLFWPRGATAALGRALSDAFAANSAYLSDAVARLTKTSESVDIDGSARMSHGAYLLLDDAFRQFVTERGAQVVPLDPIARLFTGANRPRLGAYTLGTLQ